MIKKFVDGEGNVLVFIETENSIVSVVNGHAEYAPKGIASIPATIEDAYDIKKLDIWYQIKEESK